jgi:preprotein translocase subunit YajC
MNLMTLFLQQAQGGGGNASFMWIMMIAIFVIMYFFMIRPQSKKQKEINNFRKTIKVGQHVITAGGIYGEIKEINDNVIVLEISNNVKIKIDINSVFADPSDTAGKLNK